MQESDSDRPTDDVLNALQVIFARSTKSEQPPSIKDWKEALA